MEYDKAKAEKRRGREEEGNERVSNRKESTTAMNSAMRG